MKIALIGSAPSSITLAPFADPSWLIWGCSPGAYVHCARADVWFELHRWQPPVLGRADKQVPWLSPEYCAWMAQRPLVYMARPVREIPNSMALPVDSLVARYGNYFFTSSLSWMMAMAINKIVENRELPEEHAIGLWGVDMAAEEEYGYQRAGCQFFIQLAIASGIKVVLPPESDLMRPPPLYGICESTPADIKLEAREKELAARLANAQAQMQAVTQEVACMSGALSDLRYQRRTWIGQPGVLADFNGAVRYPGEPTPMPVEKAAE